MRTPFPKLPHTTRFGLVVGILLLSMLTICGVAAVYIMDIRSDLAKVTGGEMSLAEDVRSVASGGLGEVILFERIVRHGAEAQTDPEKLALYEDARKAFYTAKSEIDAVIEKGSARARDQIISPINEQARNDILVLMDRLQEMKREHSAFILKAEDIFQKLENGQIEAAVRDANTIGPAQTTLLRTHIEQIVSMVRSATEGAIADAEQREKRGLQTLGVSLLAVLAMGTIGGVISVRLLGYDLLRRQLRENRLHERASYDKLTEMPNRAHFQSLTENALHAAKRGTKKMALLFIDIDGFKAVNDEHGHAMGDEVLKEIGERLKRSVREADTAGRLGGDEFAVNLTGVESPEAARMTARRIADYLSVPYYFGDKELHLGASIGIALCPDDSDDIDSLMQRADQAMYAAKESGGNAVLLFSELVAALAHDDSIVQFAQRRGGGPSTP